MRHTRSLVFVAVVVASVSLAACAPKVVEEVTEAVEGASVDASATVDAAVGAATTVGPYRVSVEAPVLVVSEGPPEPGVTPGYRKIVVPVAVVNPSKREDGAVPLPALFTFELKDRGGTLMQPWGLGMTGGGVPEAAEDEPSFGAPGATPMPSEGASAGIESPPFRLRSHNPSPPVTAIQPGATLSLRPEFIVPESPQRLVLRYWPVLGKPGIRIEFTLD